ncbi:MAG TPA: indole-3-glycerol-phosphate synthase [Planctomycetes bacterium]|nr:indole-3-glycerol-phosphate synthase [Planctomycetota bacterium]
MKPMELAHLLSLDGDKGTAFLEHMARGSAHRASSARALKSEKELRRQALDMAPCRHLILSPHGFDLIAEVKFRSPTEGALGNPEFLEARTDPHAGLLRARAYARAGACAISVLTEPFAFRGSLEHLRRVAGAIEIPVMRKDFLVDTYQVWEARAEGADGVLLVLRILDDERAASMLDACEEAGMFAVLEAFDEADLERAGRLLDRPHEERILVGVNNRNLDTLGVDIERCRALAGALPAGIPAIAESGILSPADARSVASAGYPLVLVGSALARSADPAALIARLLRAGRRGRAGGSA